MLDTHEIENPALLCQFRLLKPCGLIVDVCSTVVPISCPHMTKNNSTFDSVGGGLHLVMQHANRKLPFSFAPPEVAAIGAPEGTIL